MAPRWAAEVAPSIVLPSSKALSRVWVIFADGSSPETSAVARSTAFDVEPLPTKMDAVSVSLTSLSAQGLAVFTQLPLKVQTPLWVRVEAVSNDTVTSPLLPPPLKPVPAVTAVMSPTPLMLPAVAQASVPLPSV